ncbi:MAG TPA: hypothetical protein DEA44_15525 [Firmicutes bacterium]|nr:hypothetical protein [Bacillota bacterium]HWR56343.1 hypothetical protein [Negativicutes bacterium]
MLILVSIDDTDDLESKGTGELAEEIAAEIKKRSWGHTSGITRHQLYVHPDIPYTSHNSAMCFEADIQQKYFSEIIAYSAQFLARESAPASDPGLCVVDIEALYDRSAFISFGRRAKGEVITKDEAYKTALSHGVHLSEHGGTGQGVIGALAGAGLRLGGNDGRFKGKISLKDAAATMTVRELMSCTPIEEVHNIEGEQINPADVISIDSEMKTVLLGHRQVLLVRPAEHAKARWTPATKQQLKRF